MVYSHSGTLYSSENEQRQLSATLWMNLTNIILSERSQTQNGTYSHDSVYTEFRNKQNSSMLLEVRIAFTGIGCERKGIQGAF